jgi:hypothetical protein
VSQNTQEEQYEVLDTIVEDIDRSANPFRELKLLTQWTGALRDLRPKGSLTKLARHRDIVFTVVDNPREAADERFPHISLQDVIASVQNHPSLIGNPRNQPNAIEDLLVLAAKEMNPSVRDFSNDLKVIKDMVHCESLLACSTAAEVSTHLFVHFMLFISSLEGCWRYEAMLLSVPSTTRLYGGGA